MQEILQSGLKLITRKRKNMKEKQELSSHEKQLLNQRGIIEKEALLTIFNNMCNDINTDIDKDNQEQKVEYKIQFKGGSSRSESLSKAFKMLGEKLNESSDYIFQKCSIIKLRF